MDGKLVKRFRGRRIRGEVRQAEALLHLRSMEPESAAIVFLDPPFNLGKIYGRSRNSDRKPESLYHAWIADVCTEAIRVLEPGGALFLYHLPSWALRLGALLQEHLELRHWIAVSMKNGFARGERLYPAHYGLLYFTKGPPGAFARPRLQPERCRTCGETVRDYGGYRQIIEGKGVNLSDFWTDISPVRHKSTKTRAANELPSRMTDRVLAIAGHKGRIFVDPFCGSGAAVASAAKAGMKFLASDASLANCRLTISRIASTS